MVARSSTRGDDQPWGSRELRRGVGGSVTPFPDSRKEKKEFSSLLELSATGGQKKGPLRFFSFIIVKILEEVGGQGSDQLEF